MIKLTEEEKEALTAIAYCNSPSLTCKDCPYNIAKNNSCRIQDKKKAHFTSSVILALLKKDTTDEKETKEIYQIVIEDSKEKTINFIKLSKQEYNFLKWVFDIFFTNYEIELTLIDNIAQEHTE